MCRINRFALLACLVIWPAIAPAQQPEIAPTITAEKYSLEIGGPTLITLHYKDAAVDDVLAEIARQTNEQLQKLPAGPRLRDIDFLPEHGNRKVSVDIDRQPFWLALREMFLKNNLENLSLHRSDVSDPSWRGIGAELLHGEYRLSGPFLVMLEPGGNHARLTFAPGGKTSKTATCNTGMQIFLDPKVNADFVLPMVVDRVVDEQGEALSSQIPTNGPLLSTADAYENFGQAIVTLSQPQERLARFSGGFHFVQSTGNSRWEVADVLHAQNVVHNFQFNGSDVRLTLNSVEKSENGYLVTLTVAGPKLSITSARLDYATNISQFLHLYDANGAELEFLQERDAPAPNSADHIWKIEYTAARDFVVKPTGAPAKLVLALPDDLREIVVPFNFVDLKRP